MKRIYLVALVIFANMLYSQQITSRDCKDSVFNLSHNQFICKQELIGNWKLDSVSSGIGEVINAGNVAKDSMETKWQFFATGDLYIYTKNYKIYCKFLFYNGAFILKDIEYSDGIKLVYPKKYSVVAITKDRLELYCMKAEVPTQRLIFKKSQ